MCKKVFKIFAMAAVILLAVVLTKYILSENGFQNFRGARAQIDWVDCVKINDVKYYSTDEKIEVESSAVGEKIGTVEFNVSQNIKNPYYRLKNGDATHLFVGTELYGYNENTGYIVVKNEERYYLYHAE